MIIITNKCCYVLDLKAFLFFSLSLLDPSIVFINNTTNNTNNSIQNYNIIYLGPKYNKNIKPLQKERERESKNMVRLMNIHETTSTTTTKVPLKGFTISSSSSIIYS